MLRISFSLIFVLILFCSMPSFAQTKKIVNGSQDCGPGRHFVRAHPRNPTVRADGVAVSGSYVDAHCQDNVKGYSFWNPKLNDNRPKEWPLPSEKTKKWSVAEQELMFEALSRVPEVLWPKNLNIFRMDRSKDHPNPASARKGEIVLYDPIFNQKNDLGRILTHELSHQYLFNLPDNLSEDYRKATEWINVAGKGEKPIFVTLRKSFVADDGNSSVQEDFANNVEYYLYDPQKLKEKTP